MAEDTAPEEKPEQPQPEKAARRGPWRIVVAVAVAVIALALIPLVHLGKGYAWDSNEMIATYILSGVILAVEIGVIILLRVARTRYTVERRIIEQPEVNEYVILWNRPRWILYTPTMIVSVVFGLMLVLRHYHLFPQAVTPRMLGGIWVTLGIINVLVEQFHMSIKVVFIIVPSLGALLLVLHLVGYADDAIRLVRYAAVNVPAKLYFLAAFTIALIIFIGWLHGLFHYMAITPNVADLQRGLTETGRQIKNADYDVDFDATDVVERWLFGFGRIIISLKDPNKPPMVFFVPRASHVDERIRRVRSVTAIDRSAEDNLF
ncbi:MAG: hypothetical protein R6X33_07660 [Candidatus Brocadiia bacterium]